MRWPSLILSEVISGQSEMQLPEIAMGSWDTGMRCVWDGTKNPLDRMLEGCGFACPSPWGPYGNYKTWKAQEDAGLQPGGSWKEALEQTHFCAPPGHCCCRPMCNVPALQQESFLGINWSDKYMRNLLNRKIQFDILKKSGFYHIKTFSPDGLREIAETFGTDAADPSLALGAQTTAHVYVGVPNRYLSSLATSIDDCKEYIKEKILPYKGIVKMLIVGNEPFLCIKTAEWAQNQECGSIQVPAKLLPAMRNMRTAALELGLDVPVSTAFNGGIMEMSANPWTPCVADYKDYLKPLLEPIWEFLEYQTPPAPFIVNIYSWFATMAGHLPPSSSCGYYEPYQRDEWGELVTTIDAETGEPVPVPFAVPFDGDYNYVFNYDMQVDMQRVAMCKNGLFNVPLWIGETGWPSGGHKFATHMNSKIYMQNIVHRSNGTLIAPADIDNARWSGVPHTVFLFEAFDEEYKFEIEHGNKFENEFGLFHEIGTKKWVTGDGLMDLPMIRPEDFPVSTTH